MDRADDAKKRLAALHQPIPRATKAAVAQNRAEDESRRETTMKQRLMGFVRKGPDVSLASQVGEPTLVDPTPVNARDIIAQEARVSAAVEPSRKGATVEIVKPDQPSADAAPGDAAAGSDTTNPASPFGQPPAAAAATQPPAADPNELKPNVPADPNELKPNDSGDQALPPPPQVNEIQQAQSSSSATKANADSSAPATDEEISSSKKKKKKGMKKVIPF